MTSNLDDAVGTPHLGELLTSYCFGGLAEGDQEAVEQHLMACDTCWAQFQRLDAAVRTLRFDRAVGPMLPAREVISVLGLSGRFNGSFAGHVGFVWAVAAVFGFEWTVGLWSALGYSYDRFGSLAWELSIQVGIWAAGSLVLALWFDLKATRLGATTGLLRSTTIALLTLGSLVACLMFILPAERTILASLQTRTASVGYFKDAISIFVPLLLFILPPFHTVIRLQRAMAAGHHHQVLSLLSRRPERITPRGTLYLSPRFLAVFLVIAGIAKFAGMNYMLDALTPGPYAHLFSLAAYVSTGMWFAIAMVSLAWYSTSLNELKREATLAALTRREPSEKRH